MRLETFILADAVSAPPDGKFYVLGGGISKFNLVQTPTVSPIGILARFALDEGESPAPHRLSIRLLDPGEKDMLQGRLEIPMLVPDEAPNWAEGEQHFIALAINLGGIPISREGLYRLMVLLDGDLVKEVTLPAVRVKPNPLQEAALRQLQEKGA